ncbi:MAG TPA: GNAT family N-acetyltransferase [Longimicrobium sp.]|nr:GNAT family N-acetyltransferase [Longimicrobium sp.]
MPPAAPAPPPRATGALLPLTLADKEGRMFTVRPFEPADRAGLEAFYDAFDPKRAAQGLPPEGPVRVARWLDGILGSGTHLVVEREGRMIGHAMLIPTGTEGMSEYAIFLDREVRGQGVGTQVNRVSVEVARTMNVEKLWLSVEPTNRPALRSYEKAGFRFRPGTVYSPEVEMEMVL